MAGRPGKLVLENGQIFTGQAFGAEGEVDGEVCFNTSMTGYQEILSDPSYTRQIVTLTYPHIGNTGTTPEDEESPGAAAAGLVIRDLPLLASSWRNTLSLPEYLQRANVVAQVEGVIVAFAEQAQRAGGRFAFRPRALLSKRYGRRRWFDHLFKGVLEACGEC